MRDDIELPNPENLTPAPVRHRLRVELDAPVSDVWALVGDHTRMPEYTAGIWSVVLERPASSPGVRVCHFRGPDGAENGPALREVIRWEAPQVGYASSSEPGNVFGLRDDLSFVTVTPGPSGTTFTWEQRYDGDDLAAMRASFDDAFEDIGRRLVARFGGRVLERTIDGPR